MSEKELLSTILGASIVIILIFLVVLLIVSIIHIVSLWKLYKKAGKNGWESLIPFYSNYVLIVDVAELNWWYFLISMMSGFVLLFTNKLGLVVNIINMALNFFIFYNIAKKMKLSPTTYGVLGMFFSGILVIIFGFSSKYKYYKNIPVSPNGPIGDNNNNSINTDGLVKYCSNCGNKLESDAKYCGACGNKV